MIRRVVLIKLKAAYAAGPARDEVARLSVEALGQVAQIRSLDVSLAADEPTARQWDLCLTVGLDGLGDLEGYVADPVHRSYVDEYLRPRAEALQAWNFVDRT